MSKIERFEDLKCWQAARRMVKEVFLVCEHGRLAKDFETRGQFKQAALSAMNNIAEGFGRYHLKDSLRFYDISQSSTLEVQSMLYSLVDVSYLSEEKAEDIRRIAEETKNLTLGLIKYVSNKTR
ncbi:MAG TPA: four helix bundle protein [Chryseosolibacter sp.]